MKYKTYWGKKGGITISGGEPLAQIDFVLELFKLAKKEGISLNQYINDAIVSKNSEMRTLNFLSEDVLAFAERMKRAIAGGSTYSSNTEILFSSQFKDNGYRLN